MRSGARAVLGTMFTPVRLDGATPTSLVRGGALAVSGLLAQGVLRFATSLLIGRVAGREELGVVASAIALATILALLWPTSTGSAASKFLARARGGGAPEQTRAIATHLRRRAVATTLLLAAAAPAVWVVVDEGSWAGGAAVAAITLGYGGYTFTRGVQFGTAQSLRATCWDLACVVTGLAGLAALLLLGVGGLVLVLPLAVAYGVYAVAGWPYGRPVVPDRDERRELDRFVAIATVGTLASTGFLQLSQIVAKLVDGDEGAGLYAAALALATPASMLAASLTLVLLPALSETLGRDDAAAFRSRTDRANRTLTAVAVAVFGAIALCSRLLVDLVWGESYTGTATVLTVLVIAVLCTNLPVVSVNALTARSERGMLVTVAASVGGMAVGVLGWIVLAPVLGGPGVALGYLCGAAVIAAVPIAAVWRAGGHRWGGVYIRVALALAVLAALVWAQRAWEVPVLLDPVLAGGMLLVWGLANRREVARLHRPWAGR